MPYKYEPDGGVDDDGNDTYSMVWYPDFVDQSESETFDPMKRDQKPGEVVNSTGVPLGTTQAQMDKYFSSLKPGETAIGGYDAAQYNEIKKIAADQGLGKNWLDSALAAGKGYVDKAIAKYTTKNGDIDWGALGKDVLSFGAAVSAYNSASQPIPKTGYKGGIPNYTALSQRTTDPGADYRPGQGGHQYFTGNFFADPEADQSGDQGLAALQKLVAQQKTDIEAANARRSAAYNAANPPFKSTDADSDKFFGRTTKDNLAKSTIGDRTKDGTLLSNVDTSKVTKIDTTVGGGGVDTIKSGGGVDTIVGGGGVDTIKSGGGVDTIVGGGGVDTTKTPIKFDSTKHSEALNLLVKNLQDLIAGGNSAGAKKIYAAKQAQYGFTDAEVAPYILGGKFNATQIGEWKSNPVNPDDPNQKAALAQLGQGLQSLVSGGNEAGAKALYNQKQKDLGFTDAQIAPYLLGGKFNATQIGEWKGNTANTTVTKDQFNAANPAQQGIINDFAKGLQSLISSGNEAAAKDLYKQKQAQYGFTDAEIAPALLGGKFNASQIGEWKSNTGTSGANTGIGGIFQKVYDPKTGREFNSPMQAAQYGVTDYVTSLPSTTALPATAQKAVNDWLALPENKGKTATDALNAIGSRFGMTGEQFRNAEIQGSLGYGDQQAVRSAVSKESGGLKPAELVAKLQAYKDKPPTTAQEYADQQALYADYANRYANSSYNYANMGGKSQDFSFKPTDYLGVKATGYADPVNELLSSMKQDTPSFQRDVKLLQAHPEINEAIKNVMAANPDAFKGGGLEGYINNLASDIEQIGSGAAIKNFYKQQQDLINFGKDSFAGESQNMSNSGYSALQKLAMDQTVKADDNAWNAMVKRGIGQNKIDAVWRDPVTGRGVAAGTDGLMYIDRDGRPLSMSVANEGDLIKNAEKYGIDLSNIGGLGDKLKTANSNVGLNFGDVAQGKTAAKVSSMDWLRDQIGHDVNPATAIDMFHSGQRLAGDNTGIGGLTGGVTGQDTTNTGITGLTGATPISQNNTLAGSNITTPVTTGVTSTQSTPNYTDKQIQDAIAASRTQGYSDEDILKGAKNNFGGFDVSKYLTPTPFAAGGSLNHHGTYLQGSTDGMADKIPGTIDGIQPARLAHGEFVIPADVVSHLGNGNSDAGAKQLYKMMDRIRMARTGTKDQGKKINPNKFMPGGLAQIAQYAEGGILQFAGTDGSLVPTGTIGTEQGLSEWAGPYVTKMLGKGQALVNQELTKPQFYQGQLTAGDSALQQKAYYNAGNLGVPESIGTAANTAGTAATKMGGLSYRPGDISPFMSPYTQNVTDVVNQEAKRNADIAATQRHAGAVSAGAFGGSRQAIGDAEADRNLAMLQSANTARGLQDAYTAATNASQFGATYGLNALQGATAAASTQGSLGAAQNAAGLANLNTQLTAGNQQQATTQAGLTADKAMFAEQKADPFNMLKYQQELISGLPIQSSSYNMLNNPWTAAAGAATTVNTALTPK
jgi:hypothetical protein